MIRRKIESLDDDDRRLLLAGSVQGYQFDSSVVARAIEVAPTVVEERLDALERVHAFVRFISEREFPDGTPTVRYQFVHVLYQNALYESLRATRRATLSAAVAQAMVGFYKDQSAVVASELALLFEAARDAAAASKYFLAAAQNAVRVFAHQEAAGLARHGLELVKAVPDRTDGTRQELQLLLTLGTAVTALAGFSAPELLQTYTRARELCEELGDNPHLGYVLHGLYRYHLVRSELPIAYEAAGRLVAFADQSHEAGLVRIASGAAGVPLLHMGDFDAARKQFERCIDGYDPEPLRAYTMRHGADPGMAAMLWLSMVLWLQGFPDQATTRNRQALELARRVNSPFGLAYALSLTAWFHHMRRERGLAEHHAEAALALSREHGFVQWLAVARMFHSWARAQRGLEEGLADLADSVASFKSTSAELDLPHFLGMLADAHLAIGDPEEGLSSLNQALAAVHRNRDRYWEPELYRLEGELRARLGAGRDEVEECLRQAVEVARQQHARSLELRALTRLSSVMRGTPDHTAIRAELTAAYEAFTEGADTPDLRDAKTELGAS
jgi:adenylate cyclase